MNYLQKTQFLTIMAFICTFISCRETAFREDKVFAGGKHVSKEMLNLGKSTYMEYCMACHGENGDGQGVAAKGLVPPPRDFTKGLFKFGHVLAGELPTDADLTRIVVEGLPGTAMLPWAFEKGERLEAVVQYIKTFAPSVWEGADKKVGVEVELIKDPYSAHQEFAIQKGKEVYHMVANCQSCHRGYASKEELNQMSLKLNNELFSGLDEDFYKLKNQESEYGAMTLPPDFTWHELRSAQTVEVLAKRLAAGVAGTAMPSWKGTIEDNEIWAAAYYVKSLMELKGTPEREKLMGQLNK